MSFTKDWRPKDWAQIKHNVINETPIVFSPSTGYSKATTDQVIERAIDKVLEALMLEAPLN